MQERMNPISGLLYYLIQHIGLISIYATSKPLNKLKCFLAIRKTSNYWNYFRPIILLGRQSLNYDLIDFNHYEIINFLFHYGYRKFNLNLSFERNFLKLKLTLETTKGLIS